MRDSEAAVTAETAAAGFAVRSAHATAATSVLAGSMPEPLLSTRARGFHDLTVELHAFGGLDAMVQARDHVVAVHLGGDVTLHRTRNGRTETRSMRAGDVTLTPVGSPVRWRQTGHSLVVLIRIAPDYVCRVASEECGVDAGAVELQAAFATRDDAIDDLGRRLLAGLELEGPDSHIYVDALSCELALRLVRGHTTAAAPTTWPRVRLPPHKLRRAVQYIDDNLRSHLTLTAIAAAVALSPGHFAHAFRQATGASPHRYVLTRRVERAKALLLQSDMPIMQIAELVGCSSPSHFSVLFHRVTGVTPRQFRALG
jgi:AraC family transcriptional regulator